MFAWSCGTSRGVRLRIAVLLQTPQYTVEAEADRSLFKVKKKIRGAGESHTSASLGTAFYILVIILRYIFFTILTALFIISVKKKAAA